MNIDIKEYMKYHTLFLDGAMGSILQSKGIATTKSPERLNLTHPEVITDIHKQYYKAGSNVISTHTFGANLIKYDVDELETIIKAAIDNAKAAKDAILAETSDDIPRWIALDIGPTGKMLAPYGDFDFEDAVSTYATTIKLGVKYGVDLILIETMSDSYETKAALLAAKENSNLPILVSNSYGEDGKLLTGATPAAMVALLEGMGADAIGVNCSLGPKALEPIVNQYLQYASVPVILMPNAGLPTIVSNKTVYDVSPEEFATDISSLIPKGVRVVGGCCGSTPSHIKALVDASIDKSPGFLIPKNITLVSSYTHAVEFGTRPILIGERINPTGKKLFKEALRNNDINYILNEGIKQQEAGVDILDVNVGLPEIDEPKLLKDCVCSLQAIIDLPLQIDTSDAVALESTLRRYNGKAMINSVNGKEESMHTVFPLAKKYGGLIVALLLDEDGIPTDLQTQIILAHKILNTAKEYGIDRKDIIFDPLALAISADNQAAKRTLKAVSLLSTMGCCTSLGVSNVSFGLPNRDIINSSFFTCACFEGLSAAIINPFSTELMKAYHSYLAISGYDENCNNYINFATEHSDVLTTTNVSSSSTSNNISAINNLNNTSKDHDLNNSTDSISPLQRAIIKGLSAEATIHTKDRLATNSALDIINSEIIPALDSVGADFEAKKKYLPQLLMSAEAAKASFDVIKEFSDTTSTLKKSTFILATVKGDIHDIGKNIVKLLLENYGYEVVDLGRDVPPKKIVDETIKRHAPLVGLSALMTTTTPAMAETITLLKEHAPWAKIIVGGAVLTQEYADSIGANYYAKDALDTVRYCEEFE